MNRAVGLFTICVFVFLMFVGPSWHDARGESASPDAIAADVIDVIDGNTITVLVDGQQVTVRYIGISIPDVTLASNLSSQIEALKRNLALVGGKTVFLVQDSTDVDEEGRLLRYVFVGSTLVNAELVRLGYAEVATTPPNIILGGLFSALQQEAQTDQLGVWSVTEPSPTEPPSGEVTIRVIAPRLNVRSGPDAECYGIIGALVSDTTVTPTGVLSDGSWYSFDFEDQEGWISGDARLVEAAGSVSDVPVVEAPIPPTGCELPAYIRAADPNVCTGATSGAITGQIWQTQLPVTASCTRNLLRWESEARLQQASHTPESCRTPPPSTDLGKTAHFDSFWALDDVAVGYFVLGQRLASTDTALARAAFETILNRYSCAWAWDPQGWFWSLAQGARDELAKLR